MKLVPCLCVWTLAAIIVVGAPRELLAQSCQTAFALPPPPIADGFSGPVDPVDLPYQLSGSAFAELTAPGVRHIGEDVAAAAGQPVKAIANGNVIYVCVGIGGYSQAVVIEHRLPDGSYVTSVYGHLSRRAGLALTNTGLILKGQVLGYVGYSDENGQGGPHLHLGIRRGNPHSWVYYGSTGKGEDVDVDLSGVNIGGSFTRPSVFIANHQLPTTVVARDDNFTVKSGSSLVVPAPGVLQNDTYVGGVSVTWLAAPMNDFTDLGAGGFLYRAPTGFTGIVQLVYSIHTNTVDSLPATVSIDVQPPGTWTLTSTNVLQVRFTAPASAVDTLVFVPAFGSNSGVVSDVTTVYSRGAQLGSQTTFAPLSTKFFRSPTSFWPTGTVIDFSSFNNALPIQGMVEFRITSGSVVIDASRLTIGLGLSFAGGGANFCGCVTIQSVVIVPR